MFIWEISVQTVRDDLLEELHSIYSGAPSATYAAYRKAQEALQTLEDMTFSNDEIDAFLPKELKKENGTALLSYFQMLKVEIDRI